MEEKVFLDDGNVKVTSSRFIADGATYPIANISSVKSDIDPPNQALAAVSLFLGFYFFYDDMMAFGFIFLSLALIFSPLVLAKPKYVVLLTSAGSDSKALCSKDKSEIDNVISALNDAIVYRG